MRIKKLLLALSLLLPACASIPDMRTVGIFPARPSAPRVGEVFRDCPGCPEMVVVPAGEYFMGVAPGEEAEEAVLQFPSRKTPQWHIRIGAPFAIGRMEVKRGEFGDFVREMNYTVGDSCWAWENSRWNNSGNASWRSPGFMQDDRHPVVCVSWNDAQAYVAWLSRKTGKSYRLLSEAEWEYAARAGMQSRRPWGDKAEAGCEHANIADATARRQVAGINWGTSCDDRHAYTAPAGRYQANGFGLHDMIGNAFEWAADCWNESLVGGPVDGTARTDGDCSRRVIRGGSWSVDSTSARSAYRGQLTSGYRGGAYGFRVARTL